MSDTEKTDCYSGYRGLRLGQDVVGQQLYDNPDVIIGEVCSRLSLGETLASISRDPKMPSAETIQVWTRSREEVATAIAYARDRGWDAIAEDTVDIADGKRPVLIVCDDGEERLVNDPTRDKLRVDTRLKLLAKWNPKKYGDSVQLKHADADGKKLDTGPLVAELLGMLGGQVVLPGEVDKDG